MFPQKQGILNLKHTETHEFPLPCLDGSLYLCYGDNFLTFEQCSKDELEVLSFYHLIVWFTRNYDSEWVEIMIDQEFWVTSSRATNFMNECLYDAFFDCYSNKRIKSYNYLFCMGDGRCSVHYTSLLKVSSSHSFALFISNCTHSNYNYDILVKLLWEFDAQIIAINNGRSIGADKVVHEYGIKAINDLRGYAPFGIKPILLLLRAKESDLAEYRSNSATKNHWSSYYAMVLRACKFCMILYAYYPKRRFYDINNRSL